jgi:hypothetical protein
MKFEHSLVEQTDISTLTDRKEGNLLSVWPQTETWTEAGWTDWENFEPSRAEQHRKEWRMTGLLKRGENMRKRKFNRPENSKEEESLSFISWITSSKTVQSEFDD